MVRQWQVFLLVLSSVSVARAKKEVTGKMTYLWPIHHSSTALSGKNGLEPASLGNKLKDIALKKWDKYLAEVLPAELKGDEVYREQFDKMDHSRSNLAFRRWQQRAFSSHEKFPIKRIADKGSTPPKLDGIDYSWPELYESSEFRTLLKRISQMAKVYLKRSGYEPEELKQNFLVFPWVEVFMKGEAMRPMTRTDGAHVYGRYFASVKSRSMKFNYEDPRGINPPYGKTYSNDVYQGELAMLPSWVSTFITPNMDNQTAVSFCFLVYPENGRQHWADDKTGDIKVNENFQILKKTKK